MTEDSPVGNKLFGVYRGQVVQHLTHGYCKIYIPSVYPEEWKNKPQFLPPAEQAASLFGGTNNGSGVFTYPNIGSIVWCLFANNDQNYPVYFAACLGGENAFGQHEIIKSPDEEVSERHLITSGKTHIEWYENGKLSVQVEDPDRRDAIVNYNNYIDQISDDVVSARPTYDKIANNELSNIYCKLVMDNADSAHGTLELATHYFDVNENDVKYANDHVIELRNDGTISCSTTLKSKSNNQDNSILHMTIADNDAAWNFDIKGKSDSIDCQINQKSSTYEGKSSYKIDNNIASTVSYIDMSTKDGMLIIDIDDKGSNHSKITMTKAGVLTIDTTDKVVIHAPNEIQLTSDSIININAGSQISMIAPTINSKGDTVNIEGGSGDCKIDNTSLNGHTHPFNYNAGPSPALGTTNPPNS